MKREYSIELSKSLLKMILIEVAINEKIITVKPKLRVWYIPYSEKIGCCAVIFTINLPVKA